MRTLFFFSSVSLSLSVSLSPSIYLLSSLDYITTNNRDKKKPRSPKRRERRVSYTPAKQQGEETRRIRVYYHAIFLNWLLQHSSETWFRYTYTTTKPAPLWSLESSKKRRWLLPSSLLKEGFTTRSTELANHHPFFVIPAINFNELSVWERISLLLEDLRYAQNRR